MAPKTRSQSSRAPIDSTFIRIAFIMEALGNLIAIPMILYPDAILSLIPPSQSIVDAATVHPAALSDKPSPQAAMLLQWLGGMILGLTPQLVLGALENPRWVASRRMVYVTLGAGEAGLVGVMLLQVMAGPAQNAVSMKFLYGAIATLTSLMIWRAFVLVLKPEWFADGEVGAGSDKPKKQ